MKKFIEKHPKGIFASRLIGWLVCGALAPIGFIAWRFDLFTPKPKFGGWFLVCGIILFIFTNQLLKYIRESNEDEFKYSTQIIDGLYKVIFPLVCILMTLYVVRSSIDLIIQVLWVVLLCESLAITINPLGKYAFENKEVNKAKAEARKEAIKKWKNLI